MAQTGDSEQSKELLQKAIKHFKLAQVEMLASLHNQFMTYNCFLQFSVSPVTVEVTVCTVD